MEADMPTDPALRIPAPTRRELRAFAFDPMSTRLSGRFLTVDIPFEQNLRPGPAGELVQVVDYDPTRRIWYQPVDLDDRFILAQRGLRPSESDPRTHQQIVYAIAMSVIERFERFGGRRFRWLGTKSLTLVPHAFEGRNAYFDPRRGAVLFGHYRAAADDPGANLPGQQMFTCLSVDIIAHEVTHAIVHRIRKQYQNATNPDVFAWHEAFADLVALFHHFLFPEVVAEAIAGAQGNIGNARALFDLAIEFGTSTGRGKALRSAIKAERSPEAFLQATEPHERGSYFVAAVFDAFQDSYKEHLAPLLRLATGGSGILPPGALPTDLVRLATREAVTAADRFLGMVVRAFDFLPVVDVTFGDVVQAIVTADRRLFPDDEHRLRATLVEALRRRGIHPREVTSLADEALVWRVPVVDGLRISDLAAAGEALNRLIVDATRQLDLAGRRGPTADASTTDRDSDRQPSATVPDPWAGTAPPPVPEADQPARRGGAQRPDDVAFASRRLAQLLAVWGKQHALELALDPGAPIQTIGHHVAYHQGSDRQVHPVFVVQYLQRRQDLESPGMRKVDTIPVHAGTTVIARVDGSVLYVIPKPLPLADEAVLDRLRADAAAADAAAKGSRAGAAYFTATTADAKNARALADYVGRWHSAGARRLRALRSWSEQLETDDPLAAWTSEPAIQRLTFARLHAPDYPDDDDDPESPKTPPGTSATGIGRG
jgi:hypothetical protein